MNDYSVYMHLNRANGKRYVGISKDPIRRWANGRGYYRNKHFSDAIIKYGWDNFDHLILYSGLTKDEACEIEQRLISKYNTQDKRYGYNLTSGGDYFQHSEESKQLMSEHRKGKGRVKRSEHTRQLIRENHGGGAEKSPVLCIETNTIYGCINDAARDTGIHKKQISCCCRNVPHYNTAGGYHWCFTEG